MLYIVFLWEKDLKYVCVLMCSNIYVVILLVPLSFVANLSVSKTYVK